MGVGLCDTIRRSGDGASSRRVYVLLLSVSLSSMRLAPGVEQVHSGGEFWGQSAFQKPQDKVMGQTTTPGGGASRWISCSLPVISPA